MVDDPIECKPGMEDVNEFSVAMAEELPLVGFHGRVDDYGIVSLGLIMLDTFSEECQYS